MASQISSEIATRHLRMAPRPDSLATAPLLPQDLLQAQRGQVYAIRLRDTFLSVRHAFAVERGWVKSAILLTHAPGKDSLLLLWGIDAALRKYSWK